MKKFCFEYGDVFFYMEHGDVFFWYAPLKQGAVLGPDNRDLLQRDNTSIISVY